MLWRYNIAEREIFVHIHIKIIDKKDKKNKKNKSKFNDYTSFLNPEIVASDPQGMYTGVPADMYYNGELEKPIQDADDL